MIAVAVVLLLIGVWKLWPTGGHWRGYGWSCARCRTEVSNKDAAQCPTCALDWSHVGTLRRGTYAPRRRTRRAGFACLGLAWVMFAAALFRPPLRIWLPEAVVQREFEQVTTHGSFDELIRRLHDDALSSDGANRLLRDAIDGARHGDSPTSATLVVPYLWDQVDLTTPPMRAVTAELLVRQADRGAAWWPLFAQTIEAAYRQGTVTPAEMATYLDGALAPEVVILEPMPLEPGALVPLWVAPHARFESPFLRPLLRVIAADGLLPVPRTRSEFDAMDELGLDSEELWGKRWRSPAQASDLIVPFGYARVPDAPGGTFEVRGSIAFFLDDRRRRVDAMAGFERGALDLTTIGAPCAARFVGRFPIAARDDTPAARVAGSVARLHATAHIVQHFRRGYGAIEGSVAFANPNTFDRTFEVELRVGGAASVCGTITIERPSPGQGAQVSSSMSDGWGEHAMLTLDDALLVRIHCPYDGAADFTTCDIVLHALDGDEARTDERIELRDVPVRW